MVEASIEDIFRWHGELALKARALEERVAQLEAMIRQPEEEHKDGDEASVGDDRTQPG
jgi:hypothetical protein